MCYKKISDCNLQNRIIFFFFFNPDPVNVRPDPQLRAPGAPRLELETSILNILRKHLGTSILDGDSEYVAHE